MRKLLFFDKQQIGFARGFARTLEAAEKHPANPLFVSEEPWEHGNLTMYGSAVKTAGGPFQLWYSVIGPPWNMLLAYAESSDGIAFRKPALDLHPYEGRKTNILLDCDVHGPAVIYDEREPRTDWKYKMLAGASPGESIRGFHSADGVHWQPVSRYPLITTRPDCPMGLARLADGRYAAYHRSTWGRKVCRSESWDFLHWGAEPRLVLEPDAEDPPLLQFYGMGSSAYGPWELGTLWVYHVDPADPSTACGYQETELAYSRSGYAWHRLARGTPFIPHGENGSWEEGNLQCASAPVYLEDEIRFYYAATNVRHSRHWELLPQGAGVGMARCRPDRFVAMVASDDRAELLSMPFTLAKASRLMVNASVAKGGSVEVGVTDARGAPLEGMSLETCLPLSGDSLAHAVRWKGCPGDSLVAGERIRLAVRAKNARLYSLFTLEPGERPVYHSFEEL